MNPPTEAVRITPAIPRTGVWFRHALFWAVGIGVAVNLLGGFTFLAPWFRLDRIVLGDSDPPERPALRIVTGYPGASPEVVEQVITVPLEVQLNGAEGDFRDPPPSLPDAGYRHNRKIAGQWAGASGSIWG